MSTETLNTGGAFSQAKDLKNNYLGSFRRFIHYHSELLRGYLANNIFINPGIAIPKSLLKYALD